MSVDKVQHQCLNQHVRNQHITVSGRTTTTSAHSPRLQRHRLIRASSLTVYKSKPLACPYACQVHPTRRPHQVRLEVGSSTALPRSPSDHSLPRQHRRPHDTHVQPLSRCFRQIGQRALVLGGHGSSVFDMRVSEPSPRGRCRGEHMKR